MAHAAETRARAAADAEEAAAVRAAMAQSAIEAEAQRAELEARSRHMPNTVQRAARAAALAEQRRAIDAELQLLQIGDDAIADADALMAHIGK